MAAKAFSLFYSRPHRLAFKSDPPPLATLPRELRLECIDMPVRVLLGPDFAFVLWPE